MISHEGKPQVCFLITEFEMEQMEAVHGDYVHIYTYFTVTDGNILLHHSATLDNTSFTLGQLYSLATWFIFTYLMCI